MNIFILDINPTKCAQYHNSRHVIKMILEHVQMLSTACRLSGLDIGYKATHRNHPCSIWVRESLSNWLWLKELTTCLNDEYKYRYNKLINHKSFDVMMTLPEPSIPGIGLTKMAMAMPDQYRNDNVVQAYRDYYTGDKQHLADWGIQKIPDWYKKSI
jgi:hypothetical protein